MTMLPTTYQVKSILKVLAGTAFVSAMSMGLTGCDDSKAAVEMTTKTEIRPVRAQEVRFSQIYDNNSYSGEIKPRFVTDLGFRVAGKIVERKVDVGSEIKSGQLLARIDATDYRLSVISSRAQLAALQADLNKAANELSRYKSLLDKGAISSNEYDKYLNNYNTSAAKVKQAQALLDVDENKATYTDLYADRAGVVTEVLAEVGQVVAQGQTVVRIARPEEKEVAISLPENRLEQLKKAEALEVQLWAYPDLKFSGKLRELSPSADPVTRTYSARVSLTDSPKLLDKVHLGMTATVNVKGQNVQTVAILPLTALFAQQQQASVWVINGEQRVNLVPVKISDFSDNQVAVTEGVQTGQWVVTAGTHKLYEGQPVKVLK